MKQILRKAKVVISFASSSWFTTRWPVSLLVGFGRRIRSFPLSISFHHGFPCSYIAWGINNRLVAGLSSETQSHSIYMMMMMIIIIIKFLRKAGIYLQVHKLLKARRPTRKTEQEWTVSGHYCTSHSYWVLFTADIHSMEYITRPIYFCFIHPETSPLCDQRLVMWKRF
jgi:hypothetical protein